MICWPPCLIFICLKEQETAWSGVQRQEIIRKRVERELCIENLKKERWVDFCGRKELFCFSSWISAKIFCNHFSTQHLLKGDSFSHYSSALELPVFFSTQYIMPAVMSEVNIWKWVLHFPWPIGFQGMRPKNWVNRLSEYLPILGRLSYEPDLSSIDIKQH